MTAEGHTTIAVDPNAPVGTILSAMIGEMKVVLVRHAEGWTAAADACPHAGCSLSEMGEVFDETVLICNCHGSEFDLLTGEVLRDPAETPLQVLTVVPTADSSSLAIVVPNRAAGT